MPSQARPSKTLARPDLAAFVSAAVAIDTALPPIVHARSGVAALGLLAGGAS